MVVSHAPTGPLYVLMNAAAGGGCDAEKLARQLQEAGVSAVVEPVEPSRLPDRIRALGSLPRLGIAGGDGTIRTAAEHLRGTATVLVPFPTGTLNHFARRLGLGDPEAAGLAAATGDSRSAPVGVLRDGAERAFLNTAVVGAYPAVIRMRERLRPALTRWPAAFLAGIIMWARWPRFDLIVRTDQRELRRRTTMLWIGTGPGTFPAPHEAPLAKRGEGLELVLLPSEGRRHALRLFRSLWARRRGRGPDTVGLEVLRATEVEIDSHDHHRLHLTLDAEPMVVRPPFRITLEEGGLRVAGREAA
jgi:diacylglycerol kinase family enzyme